MAGTLSGTFPMTSIPSGTSNTKTSDSSTGLCTPPRNVISVAWSRWSSICSPVNRPVAEKANVKLRNSEGRGIDGDFKGHEYESRFPWVLRRPRLNDEVLLQFRRVGKEHCRRALNRLGKRLHRDLLQVRIVDPDRATVGHHELRIGFVHLPPKPTGPLKMQGSTGHLQDIAEATLHPSARTPPGMPSSRPGSRCRRSVASSATAAQDPGTIAQATTTVRIAGRGCMMGSTRSSSRKRGSRARRCYSSAISSPLLPSVR